MSIKPLSRIAIINRGEPAMRLIHAAREYGHTTGMPRTTIALFTEPERGAMFVREADEDYGLGSVTFTDDQGGVKNRYLDYGALARALKAARADAAWVGWGFVAEHAAFADLCDRLNVTFIGPPGDVIRKLGDKITSKQLAEAAHVPVAPWSGGPVATLEEAKTQAEALGYPLMLKATAGGGGRGIRKLSDATDLNVAYDSAKAEAAKAFGDDTVFLEKLVPAARHVEVQIMADHHGTVWALGVRDCSIQRKNQKVVEESASTALLPEQEKLLKEAAVRLAQRVGYRGAGTVEFLYDEAGQRFSFMEVNARLQVEHPVTELVTHTDIVKLQLHVAEGGKLEGEPPATFGHAIEVRLCAEDPDNGFMPAPGRIQKLRFPVGPGVRVDTGFEVQDAVLADFDSMIAKIMAHGKDRAEAMARLRRAIARTTVVIEGGTSNRGFLLDLLDREDVRAGTIDIGWLDRLVKAGQHIRQRDAAVAVVHAAIESYEQAQTAEKVALWSAAARGRPKVSDEIGRTIELGYQGQSYTLDVHKVRPQHYRVTVDGVGLNIVDERMADPERRLSCGSQRYRVITVAQGKNFMVEVDGATHRISADAQNVVRAPAPAVVVSIDVVPGDPVKIGDKLAVVEAMKTETTLTAPFSGRVQKILVTPNTQIDAGAAILMVEPESDQADEAQSRIDFSPLACATQLPGPAYDRALTNLSDLSHLIMGYDVHAKAPDRVGEEREAITADLPWSEGLVAQETEALTLFTDLAALFKKRPDPASDDRLGAEQYFFNYLTDLDAAGTGLPESFLKKLMRALQHFGIHDLNRTSSLEEALFRILKAQRRSQAQVKPIVSILTSRLEGVEAWATSEDTAFEALIDRMLLETEERFEVVHEIAREVRFRHFVQPKLEAARRTVYAEAERHLEELDEPLDEAARARVILNLVASPVPLRGFLSRRFEKASTSVQAAMLEVLVRSYYRNRPLADVKVVHHGSHRFVTGLYTYESARIRVLATHVAEDQLHAAAWSAKQLCEDVPADEDVVIDFYVFRQGVRENAEATQQEILATLRKTPFSRPVRRLVVSVSSLALDAGKGDVEHFTFRPAAEAPGFVEQRLYRGVHPMVGKSLGLWRLSEFETERLPSAEDVFLFRGVARMNPKDERLFALAEVRDIRPIRDDDGRIVQLPYVERVIMQALASMRWALAQRAPRARPNWNRVILSLRPPLGMRPDELTDIVRRLLPETQGLGLEKVQVNALLKHRRTKTVRERLLEVLNPSRGTTGIRLRFPADTPLQPLSKYAQKVVSLRRRGLVYPYELISMLVPAGSSLEDTKLGGKFIEHDLDDTGRLMPIVREPGENVANLVVGLIKNFTRKYPEGMTRVLLASDPSRDMGALAEPECRRILAALDLAEALSIPVEWFAVSGGAKISMTSGTENMDWVAAVLRRIVEFTQRGGIIHVIVAGVNVGAQPYWNAEATMLMHTRGILIMTARGSMVLTGKRALDFSGGVSADDNEGIGGHERIMGPNGQAQYFARDVSEACQILLRYYDHSYIISGESEVRRMETTDPQDRDVSTSLHRLTGSDFQTVGDVFSIDKNPARKKPFDIRQVMQATVDRDCFPLERWYVQKDAEGAVIWDAHLGGIAATVIGIESKPLPRMGYVPADGPDTWTAGTLFPIASKKVARALNTASGNRPAVLLANLSGFDGSPESMRNLQLEFGAEIGRAVVNFDGPVIFTVISRYHGGAFVVFSNRLNDRMQVAALEGTRASVIGGAPAAAVVFSREVERRTQSDPRVRTLRDKLRAADNRNMVLWAELNELEAQVRAEQLGAVADEFDRIHSVKRALDVGSIHTIISAARLRPYLIEALNHSSKRR